MVFGQWTHLDLPGPDVLNGFSSPDLSTVPPLISLSSSQGYYTFNCDFSGRIREEANSHHSVLVGREDRGNQRGSRINYRFSLSRGQQTLIIPHDAPGSSRQMDVGLLCYSDSQLGETPSRNQQLKRGMQRGRVARAGEWGHSRHSGLLWGNHPLWLDTVERMCKCPVSLATSSVRQALFSRLCKARTWMFTSSGNHLSEPQFHSVKWKKNRLNNL